jgi:GTPase KRas
MYAVNSRNSFDNLESFHGRLVRAMDGESACFVLLGNKCDLPDRVIAEEEGKLLALKWGVPHFSTSAKTRYNVEEAMAAVIREQRVRTFPILPVFSPFFLSFSLSNSPCCFIAM